MYQLGICYNVLEETGQLPLEIYLDVHVETAAVSSNIITQQWNVPAIVTVLIRRLQLIVILKTQIYRLFGNALASAENAIQYH